MSKVVCIAGMHRSGTSMTTRILNLCGVYLGKEHELLSPDSSNRDGYWENHQFIQLNDTLLSELNSGWDFPPTISNDWHKSFDVASLQTEASRIIQPFMSYDLWGWKDPRNCLTFPFWNELLPFMKVIICVRNPLEVMHSLQTRNSFSPALAFNLWFEYNKRIMTNSKPENRIITHYDSYFEDPYTEIARISNFLGVDLSESRIQEAVETVNVQLRHNQFTYKDIALYTPSKIIALYEEMCEQAGRNKQPVLSTYSQTQTTRDEIQPNECIQDNISMLSIRLRVAKEIIAEKENYIEILRSRLNAKEQELTNIYHSRAWRFVHLLRLARQKLPGWSMFSRQK